MSENTSENQSSATDARSKILAAAIKLFSANGYHATTTRVIAQFADVNEVTLFRHFKSKQQLFQEVLTHVKQVGFDAKRLEQEAVGLDPEAAIRYVISSLLETFEQHPKEFKIMFYAVLDEVEEFEEEFIGDHQEKLLDFLEDAFSKLGKEKQLKLNNSPRINSQMLVSTLLGLATGRILTKTLPIKKFERQEVCDYVANLYLSIN